MSYTVEQHGNRGEFHSAVTGKVYEFEVTPDKADKRRAEREMAQDHLEAERNLAKRLGRKPTLRELVRGVPPEDSRSLREQIQEDALVKSSAPHDPSVNPYAGRIAELEAAPARTRGEKAQRKRRLEMAKQSAKQWQEEEEAKVATEKEAERIASDVLDAKVNYDRARMCPGFTGDDVRVTEKLLSDLRATGDVETYRKNRDDWEAQVKERRDEAAKRLEEAAAEQRELAEEIRRGEAEAQTEAQTEVA